MGLETMGLAVHPRCGLTVGSVDEAEHLAGLLVDPVLPIVDAIGALDPKVGLMGLRDGIGLDPGQAWTSMYVGMRDLLGEASEGVSGEGSPTAGTPGPPRPVPGTP